MSAPWPRDAWVAGILGSNLKPLSRFVATIYARYAGKGDVAWVEGATLRADTGLSRDATNRALRELEESGWLTVVEVARQHRCGSARVTRWSGTRT